MSESAWQELLAAAVAGGWLTLFLTKLFITSSVRELDRIARKLETTCEKLGVIESKLEGLEHVKKMVWEHDRKIVEMETRHLNGKGRTAPAITT